MFVFHHSYWRARYKRQKQRKIRSLHVLALLSLYYIPIILLYIFYGNYIRIECCFSIYMLSQLFSLVAARTATKVQEMIGTVNTSGALSAFEKMEEKGTIC